MTVGVRADIHPFLSECGGMRRNPRGMVQITTKISAYSHRNAAECSGIHREWVKFLHKYFQPFPVESAGTRWATISLKSVIPIGPALDASGTRCRPLPISRLPPPPILLGKRGRKTSKQALIRRITDSAHHDRLIQTFLCSAATDKHVIVPAIVFVVNCSIEYYLILLNSLEGKRNPDYVQFKLGFLTTGLAQQKPWTWRIRNFARGAVLAKTQCSPKGHAGFEREEADDNI
ncbi:hypothetical protein B0H16DRAFT_1463105 [Mycena metata]|uniref:Uncharacterized protein n=1 Tax=Mycena metata TaxID=1033252 RepID=A0AAD7N3C2_9AGAR|nr:hypothetical protein B0H16DRAFT_1463105 [Mycena metata]